MAENSVILLAEDQPDDIALIRRALRKSNLLNPLHVVSDGEAAVAYLKGEGLYANRDEYPLPALLLLDLKMPRMDGFEVLQWVRSQESGLRSLRVVVLSASEEMRDVNRAYQLGANSFLVKPVEFESFAALFHALQGYWLWMSEAPDISRPVPVQARERKG